MMPSLFMTHLLRQWRLLLWMLVSCLMASVCFGSSVGALRFQHIGQDQGFVVQSVAAIAQDQHGFIWFGTQAGLLKFDGYRTTIFKNDPSNPTTISDNFASALYIHRDGRLWVGTQAGLSLYDATKQSFTNFVRRDKKSALSGNYKIQAIVDDGADGLWLATDYGLMHFDMHTQAFIDYRHDKDDPNSLRDDLITDLARDANNYLWIATPKGLDKFNPANKSFEHVDINLSNRSNSRQNDIVALSLDKDQVLWIGSDAGLSRIDLKSTQATIQTFADQEGFDLSLIRTLYHDRNNTLWVGTVNQGVFRLLKSTSSFEQFRHRPLDPNSLMHNHVNKIFQDQGGALWVASRSTGISRVDLASGGFSRYVQFQDDATGKSDNRIRALANADEDHLWLGTYSGGLMKLNLRNQRVEVWQKDVSKKLSLPDNQIASLLPLKDGRMWVGTRSGLSLFDPRTQSFVPTFISNETNDNYIEKIMLDRSGALWITSRGGLHRRLAGQQQFVTFRHDADDPDSVANNWAFTVFEDRQGTIWVGTMNGLDYFDRASGKFVHFKHDDARKDSLSHNRIHDLFEDSRGNLWVGTSGGLNRLNKMPDGQFRFEFFPTRADGTAESVGGILEDSAGNIWISTTAGLSRLNVSTGKFKNYSAKDGMIQGSYLIGATLMSANGSMNFGGWTGVTRFRPEDIADNPIPPKVVVTDFLVSNQSINKKRNDYIPNHQGGIETLKEIQLSYLDAIFSIEFSALHFADPMENSYAYQLVGFDPDWVETDAKKRFATYTNLDPGPYVFRVKASNKNGVWNEKGISLKIQISPPYWKTWWFRSAIFLLLLGLTYGLFAFRTRQLVQQKVLLAEQVTHRTRELQNQKQAIEKQKETLEHAHRNISLLSEIGKEITATLDTEAIISLLYRNVNDLMDATVFGIGFYDPARNLIEFPFVIESGKRFAPCNRDCNNKNQFPVWCIDHKKELFILDIYKEYDQYIQDLSFTDNPESWGARLQSIEVSGTPLSILYVPFFVKNEVRGVIGVQSFERSAYQSTDLDILRTLASYVGIALDNAEAYRQLQETQAQLVEREKLAALGSLVAGVAHELNTPLGNSLLIASSIEEIIQRMSETIERGSVKRSDFRNFAERCNDACTLLMRSLHTSANLVSSFKQVAVDQASAQARIFDLKKTTTEIIATMMNQVRQSQHQLVIDIPDNIAMHSYPGSYGQVLINLLQNAMLHAFEGRKQGQMKISASLLSTDRVQIKFEDNGIGIKEEYLHRIFEPFFTTKLGQGGSGLGLNVTYNIVTSLLGGQIRVESVLGEGTSFYLELPISVMED